MPDRSASPGSATPTGMPDSSPEQHSQLPRLPENFPYYLIVGEDYSDIRQAIEVVYYTTYLTYANQIKDHNGHTSKELDDLYNKLKTSQYSGEITTAWKNAKELEPDVIMTANQPTLKTLISKLNKYIVRAKSKAKEN